jgi:hypothetical protein
MLSEGGEVLVAKWDNPRFRARQMELQQEYRRPAPGRKHIKGRNIPPEIAEEINMKLVLDTILLDWRDFVDGTEEVPYSRDAAKALLAQEDFRWILDEITTAAMDEDGYRKAQEDAENLSNASTGNSSTGPMLTSLSA